MKRQKERLKERDREKETKEKMNRISPGNGEYHSRTNRPFLLEFVSAS